MIKVKLRRGGPLYPRGIDTLQLSYRGPLPDDGQSMSLGQREGIDGIFQVTLPAAIGLARKFSGDPRIVHLARSIAHFCPDEDRACVIAKIHEYVSDRVRYQDDPTAVTFSKEFLYTPLKMLKIMAERGHVRADCEEIASLTGCLLVAGGVPAGFVVGKRTHPEGILLHVWILAQGDYKGKRWIHSDPTHHVPLGRTSGKFEQYWFVPI